MKSFPPPGVKPTMILTGRAGQDSDDAIAGAASSASSAARTSAGLMRSAELENSLQEFAYFGERRLVGGRVVADMRPFFDAGIGEVVGLACLGIEDAACVAFLERAVAGRLVRGKYRRQRDRWIVIGVVGIGKRLELDGRARLRHP